MLNKLFKKNHTDERGISLIIALFTVTLLLALSLSIGGILLRQGRIINASVNSQTAFYAADSALECAIYWDIVSDDGVMNKTDPDAGTNTYLFGATPPGDLSSIIKCGPIGAPINLIRDTTDPSITKTIFYLNYSTVQYSACAYVSVTKEVDRTFIETRGYNTSADGAGCYLTDAVSRRVVERGLQYVH